MSPVSPEPNRPFRWDLVRRDRLGSALDPSLRPALHYFKPASCDLLISERVIPSGAVGRVGRCLLVGVLGSRAVRRVGN